MKRCSSCGAEIFFAETTAKKRIPIDLMPRADGNLVIRRRMGRVIAVPLSKAGALAADEVRHVSHFATCAQADQHRRSRG